MSPTQRSLKYLRAHGYHCTVVASWNSFAKLRRDVWAADILAFKGEEVLLINATDSTSVSKRLAKAGGIPEALDWAKGKTRLFVVMGWHKGKRGDDALVWRVL